MTPKLGRTRHDESRAQDGSRLPGWATILDTLAAETGEGRERRQQEIARQLRTNGIAYSPLSAAKDDGGDVRDARPWQLDLLPMIVEPLEWEGLSRALHQRARLKQALLADLYGAQRVLLDGIIPPALVYAHSNYMREATQLPGSGRLPLLSVDVCRSPSGKWYATDDVSQYPEGLGYALENRLVLSRVISRLFRQSNVKRVAPYFRALQRLVADAIDRDARCVLLGYGPSHPHYFEFTWLAKYLGYTMVELGDMTVRNQQVFVKTVDGLQRVDVILRFISDTEMDPLAIGNRRGIGIPGLLQAVRAGQVDIINPLGTGVLENPGFNAYLKPLCQHLLNEKCELLSAPTYWLGDAAQRSHVESKFDALLFRQIDAIGALQDPQLMEPVQLAALQRDIASEPHRYVAQERIDRSTAPAYVDDQLVSRQITLRSYLVESAGGYELMAGGLCLQDSDAQGRRTDFDSLDGSKDTWVLSPVPVEEESLLQPREIEFDYAMIEGELPSRVAENLFWLGRNAERAEMTVRLLRAVCRVLQGEDAPYVPEAPSPALKGLLRATTAATGTEPGFTGKGGSRRLLRPSRELISLLFDQAKNGSLASTLAKLQFSAKNSRDRLSPELMRVLNELDDRQTQLEALPRSRELSEDVDALISIVEGLDGILMLLSAYAGVAHENFTHGDGWNFMMLGRRIERARMSSTILQVMLQRDPGNSNVQENLLRLFDSTMTYRSRYRTQLDGRLVVHLLALDEDNPRSVAFQFQQIDKTVNELPGRQQRSSADPLLKLAIAGMSRVRLADAHALYESSADSRQSLQRFLGVLRELPNELGTRLTATYFSHTEQRRRLADTTLSDPEEPASVNATSNSRAVTS